MQIFIDGDPVEARTGESLLAIVKRLGLDSGDLRQRPLAAASIKARASARQHRHALQRADDQRLAGAGLAGDGVEAGAELQLQLRHQHQILNVEAFQHGD